MPDRERSIVSVIGMAIPKTAENKLKMQARVGRDFFQYSAEPLRAIVTTARGDIPALRWELDQLDADIREALIRETVVQRGISRLGAEHWLRSMGAYFIEADLDLVKAEAP